VKSRPFTQKEEMTMKKSLRTLSFSFLIFIFLLSLCPTSQAQVRGKALYEKLTEDSKKLVKFEGLSRVTWTPDGMAYYLFKDESFKKIDPISGKKSSLFDDAGIIAA